MKELTKQMLIMLGVGTISILIGHLTRGIPIIGGMWIWGYFGGIAVAHLLLTNS